MKKPTIILLKDILEESLEHEQQALNLYRQLLTKVEGSSVYLEEYTRGLIGQEEQHQLELKKMLKDFSKIPFLRSIKIF
ncbi:MAG: hypothetical protein Ct9H90mP4_01860 [Gammaproteobacteria bacterium]|nr:MAG: hypothetical protein Ct9H90mP4_01860 [Gammaproteobacteria bacterium]